MVMGTFVVGLPFQGCVVFTDVVMYKLCLECYVMSNVTTQG